MHNFMTLHTYIHELFLCNFSGVFVNYWRGTFLQSEALATDLAFPVLNKQYVSSTAS